MAAMLGSCQVILSQSAVGVMTQSSQTQLPTGQKSSINKWNKTGSARYRTKFTNLKNEALVSSVHYHSKMQNQSKSRKSKNPYF